MRSRRSFRFVPLLAFLFSFFHFFFLGEGLGRRRLGCPALTALPRTSVRGGVVWGQVGGSFLKVENPPEVPSRALVCIFAAWPSHTERATAMPVCLCGVALSYRVSHGCVCAAWPSHIERATLCLCGVALSYRIWSEPWLRLCGVAMQSRHILSW